MIYGNMWILGQFYEKFNYLIKVLNLTRISQFSAYALAIFTEYTAWATFGVCKLEVT